MVDRCPQGRLPFTECEMNRNRLFVGNLSYHTEESNLRDTFSEFGEVSSVSIVTDRETGMSRGFGFVEMATEEGAQAAIDGLNGQQVDGRSLNVNVARPREERGGGGGGGRRGGGGYGGGGGGYGGGGGGGYGGGGGDYGGGGGGYGGGGGRRGGGGGRRDDW